MSDNLFLNFTHEYTYQPVLVSFATHDPVDVTLEWLKFITQNLAEHYSDDGSLWQLGNINDFPCFHGNNTSYK